VAEGQGAREVTAGRLELADYRRRVDDLYALVCATAVRDTAAAHGGGAAVATGSSPTTPVGFRGGTSGHETYGGRYLLDSPKGAALGADAEGRLVLDFKFAYHPSCHYNPAWACPLAPRANWLIARIQAGERSYDTAV
jgi:uncharacterized protein (DUF1684 family)